MEEGIVQDDVEYTLDLLAEEIERGNGDAEVFPGVSVYCLQAIIKQECKGEKER